MALSEVFQTGLASITAARGFEMTFAGLTITFTALGTIAISISLLPRFLSILNKYVPEKSHQEVKPKQGVADEVVAAIGLAYHSLKSSGK
ncbi:MAG: hypothetical protein JW863_14315 [Chitinispirillaceae bacterium]|nr:hypothetical protein [Chitinispirillaceae bacterium]